MLLAGTRWLRDRWDRKLSCQSSNPKLTLAFPLFGNTAREKSPFPKALLFLFPGYYGKSLVWTVERVSGLKTPGCPVPLVSQSPQIQTCMEKGKELDWTGIVPGFGGEWESPRGKRGGGWDGIMCGLGDRGVY